MGSSGSGTGNPGYLSQGGVPMPNLPIAGQGAPNDNPRTFGQFQNFLPAPPAAGQGPAPVARGITADMLQYKSPQGGVAPNDIDSLRQQLAALQSQVGSGGAAGGNGQFGAAGNGSGGGRNPGFGDWQFTGAHGIPLGSGGPGGPGGYVNPNFNAFVNAGG